MWSENAEVEAAMHGPPFVPSSAGAPRPLAKLSPGKSSKNFKLASQSIVIAPSAPATTAAMALVQTNPDAYVIKPESAAPAIDTSSWPLLLKNYSDRTQPQLPSRAVQPC